MEVVTRDALQKDPTDAEIRDILKILKKRFRVHGPSNPGCDWADLKRALRGNNEALQGIINLENLGYEPAHYVPRFFGSLHGTNAPYAHLEAEPFDADGQYYFVGTFAIDLTKPGVRNLVYDEHAQNATKQFTTPPPAEKNAVDTARELGAQLMPVSHWGSITNIMWERVQLDSKARRPISNEKTWLATPASIRLKDRGKNGDQAGFAIMGYRYFSAHNVVLEYAAHREETMGFAACVKFPKNPQGR